MIGLFKNLSPKITSAALALFLAAKALAYVPKPGQIIRTQATLLRGQKPFLTKGSASNGKSRSPFSLQWYGPGNYQVSVSDIPKSFYKSASSESSWTLMRKGKACVLKSSEMMVNCAGPGVWATLELGARSDWSAKALIDAKLLNEEDGDYSETDSRDYKVETTNRRASPALGANGAKPIATIEIKGPEISKDQNGEDYPVIHFDPTFLSPLTLRYKIGADLYALQATSDLEVRHGHTRYSYILASRLDVFMNKVPIANFTRGEMVPTPKATVPANLPRAITDIVALEELLSSEGQSFLNALLLTH